MHTTYPVRRAVPSRVDIRETRQHWFLNQIDIVKQFCGFNDIYEIK